MKVIGSIMRIRVIDKLKFILDVLRVLICLPFGYWLYRKKDICIICERGVDARDNGYHMFKYIVENHPQKNTYYIIDKKSADYHKVAELGRVIDYKSWKHILYFIAARKKISSHIMGYAPGTPYRFSKIQRYLNIPGKHIFLQHGIIQNDLVALHSDRCRVDLFICGAKPEYEFVKNTFGHPNGVVRYTGLARYDNLHCYTTTRTILVMPTWRMYLSGLSNEDFMRSDYYIRWNEVLNNPLLSAMLQENNLKLVFYPHFEMQRFINCFDIENENVVIANFDNHDVQKLLMEAKLLITDYSSVFFDFAYMKKPCIYYQFDKSEFYSLHYKHGYFDCSKNGFGEVVSDISMLLEAIKGSVNRNFALEMCYAERLDNFFELHDTCNCKRIFELIEALK